jgi:hypothetical protein
MRNLIIIVILLVFLIFETNALAMKRLRESVNYDEFSAHVIADLQTKNLIALGLPKKVKIIFPNAKYAEKVIFITDSLQQKITVKVFKNLDEFEDENDLLVMNEKLVQEAIELNKHCNLKIPLIMAYKGCAVIKDKGVIYLSKAKGKTLEEIVNSLEKIEDHEIIDFFMNIGEQTGNIEVLFYKNKKQVLINQDNHLANIIYDSKGHQLWWIDTDGMELQERSKDTPPLLSDQPFVCQIFAGIYKKASPYLSPEKYPPYIQTFDSACLEEKMRILNLMSKHILAFDSLYSGYLKSIAKIGFEEENLANLEELKAKRNISYNNKLLSLEECVECFNEKMAQICRNFVTAFRYVGS